MEEGYRKYLSLLEELTGLLERLTGLAGRKRDAAHKGDLLALDECIRQEQVLSLSLRSLEQRRGAQLKELGLAGVRLEGLAAHYPEDGRLEARRTAATLRERYEEYVSASEAARRALESVLRQIERHLPQEERLESRPAAPERMKTDFRA